MLQFVKIFALSLVKWWWWNNNLSNIYVSPFLFVILLVRLNWQVYCRDSFQLPNFLPDSTQPFCNTVPFWKVSRSGNSPSRFHRVNWIIKFFFQYWLPHASKQSFIWELFNLLSKTFYFFTYEIIYITESTTKHYWFEKYWIKHYGNRLGVFFIL